jgi:hypothetical protein
MTPAHPPPNPGKTEPAWCSDSDVAQNPHPGYAIDGCAFHSTRHRVENDRRRDAKLRKAGILVIRLPWRQLEREPEAVIADVAQALVRTAR